MVILEVIEVSEFWGERFLGVIELCDFGEGAEFFDGKSVALHLERFFDSEAPGIVPGD